jgi:hypothetical protein
MAESPTNVPGNGNGNFCPEKILVRFTTMSGAEEPIPEIYREAAEQVRQLARVARLTDIRGDLLELAARFERMAAYADAAIRQGLPGYPHGERLPSGCDPSRSGAGSE